MRWAGRQRHKPCRQPRLGGESCHQGRLRQVVRLSRRERPACELLQPLDQAVNLGGRSVARAAERLVTVFWGAPAACCSALTRVESSEDFREAGSWANAAKTRCQTPPFDPREKRLYTLFHGANALGRSRHGAPTRAIHSTASTNSRLSIAVCPGSPALPGNNDSIRRHGSSRRSLGTILPTQSEN